MRSKTKRSAAREFLERDHGTRTGQACRTCARPDIHADLVEWASARAAGGVTTFNRYMERYLRAAYPDCPSESALRHHVSRCMGIDLRTGRSQS